MSDEFAYAVSVHAERWEERAKEAERALFSTERRLAAAEALLAEALPILKPDAPLRWYVNDAVRDRITAFLSPKETPRP